MRMFLLAGKSSACKAMLALCWSLACSAPLQIIDIWRCDVSKEAVLMLLCLQDVHSHSFLVRLYYQKRVFMGFCCVSCEVLYLMVSSAADALNATISCKYAWQYCTVHVMLTLCLVSEWWCNRRQCLHHIAECMYTCVITWNMLVWCAVLSLQSAKVPKSGPTFCATTTSVSTVSAK